MAKVGFKSISVPDDVANRLEIIAAKYLAKHGVSLSQAAVIQMLLKYYEERKP